MLAVMKRILFSLLILTLGACVTATPPAEQQGYQRYMCDRGWSIQVDHDPEVSGAMTPWPDDHVLVTIQGRPFEMYRIKSASGEKYGTERGLTPDAGLIWWDKGNEAMLRAMILDHTADPDNAPIIVRCERLHVTTKR